MPIDLLLHKELRLFPKLQKSSIISLQYFGCKCLETLFRGPLLPLPTTEQQQLDEAWNTLPCTQVQCHDIV